MAALGNYLFNNGRYAPAAQAWGVLAQRDAANATARRALGLCLLGARDLRRAAQELRASLVMVAGWPDTVRIVGSNLQDVFSRPDDLADARAELDAQVARQPNDRELGFLVAFLDLFQGRWEEAEKRLAALAGESYRSAHKERPEDPFALFAMTHATYANGEYRQASRYLDQALEIEPSWGLFEFRLQEFYGGADEYDRHLRNLERQVELRPGLARMKFLLAYVYYFSGRYADATDLLAQVLRLEPGYGRADYFLRLARLQG